MIMITSIMHFITQSWYTCVKLSVAMIYTLSANDQVDYTLKKFILWSYNSDIEMPYQISLYIQTKQYSFPVFPFLKRKVLVLICHTVDTYFQILNILIKVNLQSMKQQCWISYVEAISMAAS
jgi:hypothetical protein